MLGCRAFGRPLGDPLFGARLRGAGFFVRCGNLGRRVGADPLQLAAQLLQFLLSCRAFSCPLGDAFFGARLRGGKLLVGRRRRGGRVSADPFQLVAQLV